MSFQVLLNRRKEFCSGAIWSWSTTRLLNVESHPEFFCQRLFKGFKANHQPNITRKRDVTCRKPRENNPRYDQFYNVTADIMLNWVRFPLKSRHRFFEISNDFCELKNPIIKKSNSKARHWRVSWADQKYIRWKIMLSRNKTDYNAEFTLSD